MSKRKPKRAYRLIGFKAYCDIDQDIIDWWESMDEGSRSDAIRELIHDALALRPQTALESVGHITCSPDLDDCGKIRAWIRDALHDMPAYLEQLVVQAASIQPSRRQARAPTSRYPRPGRCRKPAPCAQS